MSELRARRGAVPEKVVPLDTSEQERIIRDFQLDKMKQDTLWKHMLSVLFGVSAFILACNLACSVLIGCGPPLESDSPLDTGGRCLYFSLPSSLWVAVGGSSLLANGLMLLALATIVSWGAYAFALDFTGSKMQFNSARTAATAKGVRGAVGESKEEIESSLTSSSSSLPFTVPVGQPERNRLQLFYRLSRASLLLWCIACGALVAFHHDPTGLGILVILLLAGPIALAGCTKLAAQWSDELEQQISELQDSKYSYHEF